MFDFEKQYKDALEKFDTLTKQTRESYEFWYNWVMYSWKDFYSKKKWFNGGYNPPFFVSQTLQ